jgi:hypothetical protein
MITREVIVFRYFEKIKQEWGKEELFVVYLPIEFEISDRKNQLKNVQNFQKVCARKMLKCLVPPFYLDEKEDFHRFSHPHDHHPSAYGTQKMADFLLPFIL